MHGIFCAALFCAALFCAALNGCMELSVTDGLAQSTTGNTWCHYRREMESMLACPQVKLATPCRDAIVGMAMMRVAVTV
eukprot:1160479-Pelagomonas_calceolata.AAC.8